MSKERVRISSLSRSKIGSWASVPLVSIGEEDPLSVLLPPIVTKAKSRHVKYNLPPEVTSGLPPIEKKRVEVFVPIIVKKPRILTVKRECNYIPEMESIPSEISNIPDHWRDEQARVLRERPSESEVQQQILKPEERTDSIEEETEGVLPRTFFPLGVDWDSRLEATNYGTDVVLKSSSSSLMLDEPDDVRASPQDFVSVADWFIHTKGSKLTQETTVSMIGIVNSDDSYEEDDKKCKKVLMSKGPPRLIFGEQGGRDPTILAFQAARKRQRKESRERRSLDKHFKKMNETLMTEGPMDHAGLWTTDEPVAQHIMRRTTTSEPFKPKEVIHNLIRRSCLKRRTTFTSYENLLIHQLEQLDTLKNALDSIDSVRKVALDNEHLNRYCFNNDSNTVDLIIHGKKLYEEAGRRLYDFDLPYIFLFLLERPNIVGLDFCFNHLTCFGVRFLADFLSWDQRILRLNLMNNDIEAMDSYVVDAFGENKTLKTLRLNGNPFGKKGGEYVSFLLMFKDLEFLDIGQTDQTIQSLAWILGALVQTFSLKVLDLSRILGHPGYINDSLHYGLAFSDILRLNRSLVELHISKNNITDVDLEQILFGLSFNRTLELLDLSSNSIGDDGAEMMSEALLRGAPLKALMLSGNHIGNLGARALSFKLPMSQIKLLDLSNNRIKDGGIVDIVSTVKKPFPLLALFIFGNPFTAEALKVIDRHLLNGNLDANSLDIVLHDYNGIIGHGRNTSANRYKSRYYCLMERKQEKSKQNESLAFCETGCAAYKFHNVFNVRVPKTTLPSIHSKRRQATV